MFEIARFEEREMGERGGALVTRRQSWTVSTGHQEEQGGEEGGQVAPHLLGGNL